MIDLLAIKRQIMNRSQTPKKQLKPASILSSGASLLLALAVGFALTTPLPGSEGVAKVATAQPNTQTSATAAGEGQSVARSTNTTANPAPTQASSGSTLASLAAKQPTPYQGAGGYTEYPYTMLGVTNDVLAGSQWHLATTQAPTAWDRWTGSSSTTIAVIDTGFALNHEDLSPKWKLNSAEMGSTASQGPAPNCTSQGLALDKRCNNLDDDSNGYTDDWRGWDFVSDDNSPQTGTTTPNGQGVSHGSFVAGLAAGAANNSVGITGIDQGALIMPLQALNDNGDGFTSSVAEAIRYAADQGADVINLSLGSAYSDSYLRSQITYAQSLGVVVVAAAGNEGCQNCLSYPANFPEVIAVGATMSNDELAGFSSWGANLDLTAPGASGLCSIAWSSGNQTAGYSCSGQGTSFSSPLVAGTAALLKGRQPGITVDDVALALQDGADKVAGMSGALSTTRYGYGRLNVYRTLLQIAQPVSLSGLGHDDSSITISLSSNRDVVTLCRGYYGYCRLRFSNGNGDVILTPNTSVNAWGDLIVQWNPASLGLTPGEWQLAPVRIDGVLIGYPPVTITVTP